MCLTFSILNFDYFVSNKKKNGNKESQNNTVVIYGA